MVLRTPELSLQLLPSYQLVLLLLCLYTPGSIPTPTLSYFHVTSPAWFSFNVF